MDDKIETPQEGELAQRGRAKFGLHSASQARVNYVFFKPDEEETIVTWGADMVVSKPKKTGKLLRDRFLVIEDQPDLYAEIKAAYEAIDPAKYVFTGDEVLAIGVVVR